MKTSLPAVRQESLNQTHVSYEANAMFGDLMNRAKALARFLDTSTTNELAGALSTIKKNEPEQVTLFRFCMII